MPQFPNSGFSSQPLTFGSGSDWGSDGGPLPAQQQPPGVGVDLTQGPEDLFNHKNLEEQLHHHFYKRLTGMLNGGRRNGNEGVNGGSGEAARGSQPIPFGGPVPGIQNPNNPWGTGVPWTGQNPNSGAPQQLIPPGQFPDQGQLPHQFSNLPPQFQGLLQQLMQILGGGGQSQQPDQTSQWEQHSRNLPNRKIAVAGMPTGNNFLPMVMQQLGMGGRRQTFGMNAYNQSNQPGRLF
jgi:hypothetical protein